MCSNLDFECFVKVRAKHACCKYIYINFFKIYFQNRPCGFILHKNANNLKTNKTEVMDTEYKKND